MSEHQNYEFQAIDRRLDKVAQDALRSISSRARITDHRGPAKLPAQVVNRTFRVGRAAVDHAELSSEHSTQAVARLECRIVVRHAGEQPLDRSKRHPGSAKHFHPPNGFLSRQAVVAITGICSLQRKQSFAFVVTQHSDADSRPPGELTKCVSRRADCLPGPKIFRPPRLSHRVWRHRYESTTALPRSRALRFLFGTTTGSSMRMLPSQMLNVTSTAEDAVFNILRRVDLGKGALCLHSLNLPRHQYKLLERPHMLIIRTSSAL
jgi:hypothetical protein